MDDRKNLKLSVALSYTSEFLAVIISLLYTPIKVQMLGKSEYGVYQLVASVIGYLSLLSMGFGSSYVRFYSRYKAKEDKEGIARLNGMFLTIFLIIAIISLLGGGVMIANARAVFGTRLTSEELILARKLMIFLVFNIALTFPMSVFSNYLIANESFIFIKIVAILYNILLPIITFPLLMIGYKSICLVAVTTLLTFLHLLVYVFYCFKKLKIQFCFSQFDWNLLKEVWVFSFYIFISMVVDQINWSVDKLILGREVGSDSIAVYSLGAQINSLYLVFSTAISSVFIPRINSMVASGNSNKELTNLFIKIGRIQYFILTYVLLGFVILGRYFMHYMGGNGYENAYEVALLLMVPVTVPLIQNIGIEIQKAKNMHKFRSILYSGIAIGNVFITIGLVRILAEEGAALATGIALIIGNGFFMNWYYQKKVGINIISFWTNILRILPFTLLVGGAGYIIGKIVMVQNWGRFIFVGLSFSVIYFVVMWIACFNSYEKEIVSKICAKIIKRG